VADALDVSALVVPIGGMALYPAMILETSSIPWAIETFAHEWAHHYLTFFPLGFDYLASPDGLGGESRSINETAADLFGKAVARLVLARHYPDLLPPEVDATSAQPAPSAADAGDVFDFGATMHETRVMLDGLLRIGAVDAADLYLEHQRERFWAAGYPIRKLNQAYFAFYGGYQGEGGGGSGGQDPIGPALRDLMAASPNPRDFLLAVRGITTREDLLALHAERITPG
jgi:hypothetical protein